MASKISHYGLVIKKRLEGVKIVKSQYYELKKHIPIISLYVIDSGLSNLPRLGFLFRRRMAF